MEPIVREFLRTELERWRGYREEKVIQLHTLERQLSETEGHLALYNEKISAFERELSSETDTESGGDS